MVKELKITTELQCQQVVEHYAECHAELKWVSVNPRLSQDECDEAMTALHALP